MTIILVAIILFLSFGMMPAVYARGLSVGETRAIDKAIHKALEYKCMHVWQAWAVKPLNIVNQQGKLLYKSKMQVRSCELCGFTEQEELKVR